MAGRMSIFAKGWRTAAWLLVLLIGVSLAACGGNVSVTQGKKKAEEEKEKEKAAAEAAAAAVAQEQQGDESKVEKDYVYTSIGKRDPFRSIFDDAGAEAAASPEETVLSPLQNYDVNAFVVTGILCGVSSPTAVVASPDNRTYTIKTGTLIGRNWGKVIKIKCDSVVVLEQSPMPNGTKVTNTVEMKLPVKTIRPNQAETIVGGTTGFDLNEQEDEPEGSDKKANTNEEP